MRRRSSFERRRVPFASTNRRYFDNALQDSSHHTFVQKTGDCRERFVAFLEQTGKEVVTVRHSVADEMLNAPIAALAQFLCKSAVIIDKWVGAA